MIPTNNLAALTAFLSSTCVLAVAVPQKFSGPSDMACTLRASFETGNANVACIGPDGKTRYTTSIDSKSDFAVDTQIVAGKCGLFADAWLSTEWNAAKTSITFCQESAGSTPPGPYGGLPGTVTPAKDGVVSCEYVVSCETPHEYANPLPGMGNIP